MPAWCLDSKACDADARVTPDETTADILAYFTRARVAADSVINKYDLDHVATSPPGLWTGEPVSLRWVLVHVLEDAVRHAGHIDILRELIGGSAGYLPLDEVDEGLP